MGDRKPPYRGVLVEIRDLIVQSSFDDIKIPKNSFKSMRYCGATGLYHRGQLTRDTFYQRLAVDFGMTESEIRETFSTIEQATVVHGSVLESIRQIRCAWGEQVKIYAMTNMSHEEYAWVRTLSLDWSVFDGVFVSAEMGMRKPEPRSFHHVSQVTGIPLQELVVVDGEIDNVLVAMSMGLKGLLVNPSTPFVEQSLANIFGDPLSRARRFLRDNAGRLDSKTDSGVVLKENFGQLLILEQTGDRSLIYLEEHSTTWNYFIGKPLLTQATFPDDMDTTSLALTIAKTDPAVADTVMDNILHYRNEDNLVQTFFTDFKNRLDPVVACNVLSLFYTYGRGEELKDTLAWVIGVLRHRAYINGTAYYPMPEAFLFFCERMTRRAAHMPIQSELRACLRERVQERIGVPADPASLAMRLNTCQDLQVHNPHDLAALLEMQLEDGGWDFGKVYSYGSKKVGIGNRGLTTALAINAIERSERHLGSSPGICVEEKRHPFWSLLSAVNCALATGQSEAKEFSAEKHFRSGRLSWRLFVGLTILSLFWVQPAIYGASTSWISQRWLSLFGE